MKNLIITFSLALMSNVAFCQNTNSKGEYLDSDGSLLNGVVTRNQDGGKAEYSVHDGIYDGAYKYYASNGSLVEKGTYANGQKEGKWERYNDKGGISAIGFYHAGKKTGTWLVYDEQGNRRFEMNYFNGEKAGVWTNWDEAGKVVSTRDYSKVN